ncbi:MAG: cyclodeaminase/cyclohydrolase family protein [Planctomycetota bacterium]|nr:cyclodeaminase/cyclohydrolase family protein [Planctomycetota bacterium]
MSTAATAIGDWVTQLGARQPTPGGGAAAALAAATGAALGAMAARYTTGKRWADRSGQTEPLIALLDTLAAGFLDLADRDAKAYAALQASWKQNDLDPATKAQIEDDARAVPATILERCADSCESIATFVPNCNPMIVSDAKAAIHLLAGAARAAWHTLLINQPNTDMQSRAEAQLQRCSAAEQPLLPG